MRADKLAAMANQIGRFFGGQPGDAADAIADHLRKFWDPRMRREILDLANTGGKGLDPPVLEAVRRLAATARP